MSGEEYIRASVRKLHGYVPGEQPDDPTIIKLNTNENPYPPSEKVLEKLSGISGGALARYPDPVCRSLCTVAADLHGCLPQQVLMGNGSDELLALCIRAFVEDDGSVGFFHPSYSLYPVLSAIADVQMRPLALHEDFTWNMPDDYAASLFFLANPNAPTGLLFPKEVVRDFCESFSGVVVIDEAYVDFSEAHCMDLALELDNVVVTRTLSKSYSLACIRLGYAVGPEPLIQAMYRIKDSYNVNGLTQAAAKAALLDQDTMRANRDKVVATRERIEAALRQRMFHLQPSQANFIWAKPSLEPALELFEGLREHGVYVRHFPSPETADYLRITVGTDEQMDRFLEVVDILQAPPEGE